MGTYYIKNYKDAKSLVEDNKNIGYTLSDAVVLAARQVKGELAELERMKVALSDDLHAISKKDAEFFFSGHKALQKEKTQEYFRNNLRTNSDVYHAIETSISCRTEQLAQTYEYYRVQLKNLCKNFTRELRSGCGKTRAEQIEGSVQEIINIAKAYLNLVNDLAGAYEWKKRIDESDAVDVFEELDACEAVIAQYTRKLETYPYRSLETANKVINFSSIVIAEANKAIEGTEPDAN